jgi:hypothetical protein
MIKSLLILLFALSWQSLSAQYTDSTAYHVLLSSTGSINKTNDNRAYLLNNSLNFGLKKKSIVLNASNTWLYGKQNQELSNNDFSSTVNFNLYKTFKHFYYWGLLNYNTSYSLKINHQLLAGLGVAYNLVDKENAYINISNGILYDKSNLLADQIDDTYRNSFRFQFHFALKETVTLDGSNFLQSAFDNRHDYIFRSSTTLGIKIRKWISFTTALNYNKMNITNSENLNFTYGLAIDKYF